MKALCVVAAALALSPFGGTVRAGDHCPVAVVQQVVATPVVAVAAPVFVVPSAPTVAVFNQVVATPFVSAVVATPSVVVQRNVVVEVNRKRGIRRPR